MAPIADLAPDYAINSLVLELLTSEVQDCRLAGLRSLYLLVTTLPPGAAAAAAGVWGGDGWERRVWDGGGRGEGQG